MALVTEGMQRSDKNVRDVISGAMAHFRAAGITVEEVSIPWHKKGTCVTCVLSRTVPMSRFSGKVPMCALSRNVSCLSDKILVSLGLAVYRALGDPGALQAVIANRGKRSRGQ